MRRMPSLPANGARTIFFAIVAWMLSTCASACFTRGFGLTRAPRARWRGCRSAPARARGVTCAHSAAASAERSCARSMSSSSRTSSSPAFTMEPASKRISRTTPSASALTTVPCTATTEPTLGLATASIVAHLERVHGLGRQDLRRRSVAHRRELHHLDSDDDADDQHHGDEADSCGQRRPSFGSLLHASAPSAFFVHDLIDFHVSRSTTDESFFRTSLAQGAAGP